MEDEGEFEGEIKSVFDGGVHTKAAGWRDTMSGVANDEAAAGGEFVGHDAVKDPLGALDYGDGDIGHVEEILDTGLEESGIGWDGGIRGEAEVKTPFL